MLKDVRARNGIDSIFTTNSSESINAALKRKTNYKALELQEFVNTMKEFYENQDETVRSSFVGDSDHILAEAFKEFEIGESYYRLSADQRMKHEQKFYAKLSAEIAKPKAMLPKALVLQGTKSHQICGLDPKHSFNLLQKAASIIDKGLIIPSFSKGSYHVASGSAEEKPHFVKRIKAGEYKCDPDDPRNGCIAYKKSKICSHVVAASKVTGDFDQLVAKFATKKDKQPNLDNLAKYGMPSGAGKKPSEMRKRRAVLPVETITKASDRFQSQAPLKVKIVHRNGTHIAFSSQEKEYNLELLEDHPQVNVCAGCRVKFARMPSGKPYPPPDDLIISHPEHGSKRNAAGVLQVFNKISKRYYHTNIACVRNGNNGLNRAFSAEALSYDRILQRLTDEHKEAMKKNLFLDIL